MVQGSGLPPLGNSQTVLVLAICPCFKMIYFNLGTANGHLKTGRGREVAWLPIGGRTAAVGERAVGSRPPGDGVEKSCCSAAFRLRLLFCGCGVFGFGDVLLLVPWSDK